MGIRRVSSRQARGPRAPRRVRRGLLHVLGGRRHLSAHLERRRPGDLHARSDLQPCRRRLGAALAADTCAGAEPRALRAKALRPSARGTLSLRSRPERAHAYFRGTWSPRPLRSRSGLRRGAAPRYSALTDRLGAVRSVWTFRRRAGAVLPISVRRPCAESVALSSCAGALARRSRARRSAGWRIRCVTGDRTTRATTSPTASRSAFAG